MFLGHHSGVVELLPMADIFALTSRFEALPLALLEAMAAGLPCVATDVGGVGDLVRAARAGTLHAPGDVPGSLRL